MMAGAIRHARRREEVLLGRFVIDGGVAAGPA